MAFKPMHSNSASDDLAERKAFLAAYESYAATDEDTRQMSAGLRALMGEMHDYAVRYDVDLYRSFQEYGGKLTADGGGRIFKPKFKSALLAAFNRMERAFKQELLTELCLVYGRGPNDTNGQKAMAGPAAGGGGFLDIRWIDFAKDVGENYLVHKPNMSTGSPRLAAEAARAGRPLGTRGCTVGQVEHAKATVRDRLLMKHATVRDALKDVDESGDGLLTRDEVKLFLKEQYLLKFKDFYTNQIRGELEEVVVNTLLDMVDANGDGQINYEEFSATVMAGAN